MSSTGSNPAAMAGDDMSDAGGATSSDTGADTTAAGDDAEEDQSSSVLFSVKMGADGKFTLIEGDEDDGSDEAAGSPDAGMAPEGKDFDSIGPLLKAIGDILKNAQSANGGSDDDNFDAGFSAPKTPTPAS